MFYSEALLKNHARICETDYVKTKSKVLKPARLTYPNNHTQYLDLVPNMQKPKMDKCIPILPSKSDEGIFIRSIVLYHSVLF